MELPTITNRQFLTLALLLDGEERGWREVASVEGSERDSVTAHLRQLHRRGLVHKYSALERIDDGANGRTKLASGLVRLYQITEAGRQAWRETLDFYVFVANKYGDMDGCEETKRRNRHCISKRALSPGPKLPRRYLTLEEESRMVAASPRGFGLLLRSLRHFRGVRLAEIRALNVEDVDLAAGIVRLAGGDYRVNAAVGKILTEAIGERTTGPVFRSPSWKRWTHANVMQTARDVRHRCAIAANVSLVARFDRSFRRSAEQRRGGNHKLR